MKDLERIAKENAERREKFSNMLSRGEDIETIRTAAIEYFDNKIAETMVAIDFAWGAELEVACIMQRRYEEKREKVANATSSSEIVSIVA